MLKNGFVLFCFKKQNECPCDPSAGEVEAERYWRSMAWEPSRCVPEQTESKTEEQQAEMTASREGCVMGC